MATSNQAGTGPGQDPKAELPARTGTGPGEGPKAELPPRTITGPGPGPRAELPAQPKVTEPATAKPAPARRAEGGKPRAEPSTAPAEAQGPAEPAPRRAKEAAADRPARRTKGDRPGAGTGSTTAPAAADPGPELVVVANRLPVEYDEQDGWRRAPGGLVSAMEAVLRDRQTAWIGWSGRPSDAEDADELPPLPEAVGSISLAEVPLTAAEVAGHYEGFSNAALWPLYHTGVVPPVYHRSQFEAYRSVNSRFAIQVAQSAPRGALVWVQDYQLQLVPAMLRQHRPDLKIGFFLHIPFPPAELFLQMPWRREVMTGLLGADVVGFQTHQDAENFIDVARRLLGLTVDDGQVVVPTPRGDRRVVATSFPIGIRAADFAETAASPAVRERAAQIRADLGDPELLLLGVDRLDYTKGIDVRIHAVTELLQDGLLDPETTVFLQVATPSRDNVEEYRKIRDEVELLVSRANGDIGRLGSMPIHYMHQNMGAAELAAMYVAADVMLVTPLRDGMNLVAKEYVACRTESDGVLVLSEFTGAAEQMREAWLVNPYDVAGTKQGIMDAVSASDVEVHTRMEALRHGVFTDDVAKWARTFLEALAAASEDPAPTDPEVAR